MIVLLGHVLRFAFAMLGYAAAVLAAVLVSVSAMLLPTAMPGHGAWGSLDASLRDLWTVTGIGLFLTAIFAFPGFVVALVFADLRRWRRWLPFSVAGALDALVALSLFGAYGAGSATAMPVGLALPCMPGGFVGGWAYWIVAGRLLARRRQAGPA
jgi:hypothetical protein